MKMKAPILKILRVWDLDFSKMPDISIVNQ